MKGYIYITGKGADPAAANDLNDPIFRPRPSLGACMPNIRRAVDIGDFIFVVSGKRSHVQQYLIGGFRVAEKVDAIEAFRRFPENRLRIEGGRLIGNVPVDANGNKHSLDDHSADGFDRRVRNYIVGDSIEHVANEHAVAASRAGTLNLLAEVMGRPQANRPIDIIGRHSKLTEPQVAALISSIRRWNELR